MARKDVSDWLVCYAYQMRKLAKLKIWPHEMLAMWTGQPEKVCYAAIERAMRRDLIGYGVSLQSGWVTPKGWQTLTAGPCHSC
jgi:hypothetical protein